MTKYRIISTENGMLKGEVLTSKLGTKYFSFKGISYAKPPVGDFRFKPPQPVSKWYGVRDALKEGNRAPHYDMVTKQFCGDEDCLYLNVYTTELPENHEFQLKPVMFWIHGGGFAFGHADSDVYGPDLLIKHDIVLVTANYRLGVLGFLNLELECAAGNMGMKDQVEALKWVNKEIKAFGGDPNNITIFGNSAGGASVHLHILSELSKGLFHKAIAQSGNALCSWSFTTEHKERAFALGKLLGIDTSDAKELLMFFQSVPAITFAKHQDDVMTFKDHLREVDQAFVPSIEQVFLNIQPFIKNHPQFILESGKFNKVPFIMGINSHEGLSAIYNEKKYPNFIKEIDSNLKELLPVKDIVDDDVKKIRKFYFGDKNLSDDENQIVKLYTDVLFLLPTIKSILIQLKYGHKIFFYQFSYDGKYGWYKRLMAKHRNILDANIPPGTHHADELGYLFSNNILNLQDFTDLNSDLKMAELFSTIWTNFAKKGDPLIADQFSNLEWTPISEKLAYFNISENLIQTEKSSIYSIEQRINFWKSIGIL